MQIFQFIYRLIPHFIKSKILSVIKSLLGDLGLIRVKNTEIIKKLDYEKKEIYLNIDSSLELDVRLHSCKKEPETIEWIESFSPGEVFYDIGANVGAYSLVASKYFEGKVKVYSFEPGFLNFPKLCKNIVLNQCENIVPIQLALSKSKKIDNFHYHNLEIGGALHTLGEAVDIFNRGFQPAFTQQVLTMSVDELIHDYKLEIPTNIKIDVDGVELDILYGASRTLESPQCKNLLIEIVDLGNVVDIFTDFLKSKGFSLDSKHQYLFAGKDHELSKQYNFIFKK